MRRDKFLFRKSYIDLANELPKEMRLHFLESVISYALDMTLPVFDNSLERMAFVAIKPDIDKNWASHLGGKKAGNGRPLEPTKTIFINAKVKGVKP